ncbi:MAG TPA: 2OG-Fe(II) oxygenase [Pyrinomonadaceae bacterium]
MNTTYGPLTPATGICELALFDVKAEPFPHVAHERFVDPDYYRQLCRTFPTCPPSTGPTGFSLYWGDEGYQRLLDEQPAWRTLFDTFHSQAFIEWGIKQFAEVWQRDGCRIDLSEARYVPYREDRVDKERAALRRVEHDPHELWVRMDIHQGRLGYFRPVHLDHARRLVSMLIYMCDHTENKMTGGELFLHGVGGREERRPSTRITPRHNLMIAFPCTNGSHHSVSKITSAAAPRNYIQVHISSSVDVWPREAAPRGWRRVLSSVKRRLPL